MNAGQRLRACVAVALACGVATHCVAAEPEVITNIERDKIYQGESVQYEVFLNHCDRTTKPLLEGFDDFDVQFLGVRTEDQQRVVIINGRRQTTTGSRGPRYYYRLTPKHTGTLTIPAPAAEVDGKRLEGSSLTLTVVAAPEQDVAILEAAVSRDVVYPMQPFEVRLTIAAKPPPVPHDDTDPVSVQDPAVQLSIPWASDAQLPDGVEAKVPARRWLDEMLRRDGGFSVNGEPSGRSLGSAFGGFSGSMFGRFFDERAAFHPGATRALRQDAAGRRVEYWEYSFSRTLWSERVGELTFGPVSLKGVFGTRANTRGDLEGEAIYAFAKPVTVRVKDVPTEGRPDSYTGAIGRFQLGSEISPREAKVGDPMTLTLWLSGVGTLDRTLAPELDQIAAVADAFKVYEATEETAGDTRRFTYSVRPKHVGVTEVPAIPISYFDVDDEKFVTLRSDPIAIKVAEPDRFAESDIAMANTQRQKQSDIELSSEGIFANVTDLRALRDETVHPDRWFLSLGGLACLFFVVTLVTQRVQALRADDGLRRRRTAVSNARRRLHNARKFFADGEAKQGVEELSASLLGLVADARGLEPQGLTSQDASEELATAGIEPRVIARFTEVTRACDGARYGAGSGTTDDLVESAQRCLEDLVRDMQARRLLS